MTDVFLRNVPEGTKLQTVATIDGVVTADLSVPQGWGNSPNPVFAGRLASFSLDPENGGPYLSITQQPANGKAILEADGTITLQLSDLSVDAETSDFFLYTSSLGGDTENYSILPSRMAGGWHTGNCYYTGVDGNDRCIVDRDENTRDVYVELAGLDAAAIVALEPGLTDPADVTGEWLRDTEAFGQDGLYYGETEALSLAPTQGKLLWEALMAGNALPHWLHMKSGEDFTSWGKIIPNGADGLNDRFPARVTTWGGTAKATAQVAIENQSSYNIAIRNFRVAQGSTIAQGERVLIEDIEVPGELGRGLGLNSCEDGAAYRYFTGFQGWKGFAANPALWSASNDRVTPFFNARNADCLFEYMLSDSAGWRTGYDPSTNAITPSGNYVGFPQPPSQYSQGGYFKLSTGYTVRNCLWSRAALAGLQVRSGAHLHNCLFLDNNSCGNLSAGNYTGPEEFGGTDRYPFSYSFMYDNVITSAGYKTSIQANGLSQQAFGMRLNASPVSIKDNIVAHLADPNNPTEQAIKTGGQERAGITTGTGVLLSSPDDTKEYNWVLDKNLDGLTLGDLDNTTIQRFTDELRVVGYGTSTIQDFIDFLMASPDPWSIVTDAMDYFRDAFGVSRPTRVARTMTFTPPEWSDGFRFDTPANWDNQDNVQDGDSVALRGFSTRLGPITLTLVDMDLGAEGKFTTTCGKLTVATISGTGEINVERVGDMLVTGTTAPTLTVNVSTDPVPAFDDHDGEQRSAGRLAVTGALSGTVDYNVAAHGILVAYDGGDITINGSLTITGQDTRVGFDGTTGGASSITMGSGASLIVNGNSASIPVISVVWSGIDSGTTPRSVGSTFVCDGTLDLTDAEPGTYNLIEVDTVSGTFASVVGGSVDSYADGIVEVTVT